MSNLINVLVLILHQLTLETINAVWKSVDCDPCLSLSQNYVYRINKKSVKQKQVSNKKKNKKKRYP